MFEFGFAAMNGFCGGLGTPVTGLAVDWPPVEAGSVGRPTSTMGAALAGAASASSALAVTISRAMSMPDILPRWAVPGSNWGPPACKAGALTS